MLKHKSTRLEICTTGRTSQSFNISIFTSLEQFMPCSIKFKFAMFTVSDKFDNITRYILVGNYDVA